MSLLWERRTCMSGSPRSSRANLLTVGGTFRAAPARLLGTNRTYVYDALRECADQTPADFINSYRLRHAAHLLATTTDSVSLIAELCGLSRPTFYRLFSETYGMSPSDYRRVAKK